MKAVTVTMTNAPGTPDERIEEAIAAITQHGGVDGAHHKQWALDQALRALMGEERYRQWIADSEAEGYEWEEGIAP